MPDQPVPEPNPSTSQGSTSAESDLGELAALFAAHGGGGLSAEVSADLALEIVLNEIVEQACLATGATGAAIVLVRDGEMVCRASNGANAPALGAPLSSETGLTAECIKTRQVQRCDDAQSDPRADSEASRSLGVRSVIILPLLQKGEMAGVLEVFSPLPGAFGDRDERTLEALARRILQNLERASEPLLLTSSAASSSAAKSAAPLIPLAGLASARAPELEESGTDSAIGRKGFVVPLEATEAAEAAEGRARAGLDFVSLVLVVAVLVCAVLFGTLVGVRLGWRRAASVRGQGIVKSASGATTSSQSAGKSLPEENGSGPTQAGAEQGTALSSSAPSGASGLRNEKKIAAASASKLAKVKDSVPPAGSLLVYENGKEVFRMTPTDEDEAVRGTGVNDNGAQSGEVQRASALEPAVVELAPEAAEGSLLHRVEPDYPEEARQEGIQGAVVLEVRIGRDGAIQDVKLISGQPLLANAAISAVKQWRFKPRVLEGQPVEMQTRVTLNFRMPS
jgi:TonB family protein